MNMRMWLVLGLVGIVGVLALPVLAQPNLPPAGMPGPGHMGQGQPTAGQPISIVQAEKIARQVLTRAGYAGLELDEIQEFSNNFYVAVKYKTGGRGAFEFLIDRYSGFVHPEPQTMMWNTQFGHMAGWSSTGMMGGYGPGSTMGGGMMGGYGPGGTTGGGMMGGYGPGGQLGPGTGPGSAPAVKPQVTTTQAKTIAQTFLNARLSGTKVRNVDTFPGYYTLDVTRDGKVVGMLSVNAYTGRVWYHGWHGTFIQEKELD